MTKKKLPPLYLLNHDVAWYNCSEEYLPPAVHEKVLCSVNEMKRVIDESPLKGMYVPIVRMMYVPGGIMPRKISVAIAESDYLVAKENRHGVFWRRKNALKRFAHTLKSFRQFNRAIDNLELQSGFKDGFDENDIFKLKEIQMENT